MSTANNRLTNAEQERILHAWKAIGGISAISRALTEAAAMEGSIPGKPTWWDRTLEGGMFEALEVLSNEVTLDVEWLMRRREG